MCHGPVLATACSLGREGGRWMEEEEDGRGEIDGVRKRKEEKMEGTNDVEERNDKR